MMQMTSTILSWPTKTPFVIARGARTQARTVMVELCDGPWRGRGECVPYGHYGETLESVTKQIETTCAALEDKLDLTSLQTALPAGAARNALDCALWDLQARREGTRAASLCHLVEQDWVTTAFTLSVDAPQNLVAKARARQDMTILKLKLNGQNDLDCVRAVHQGAPQSAIIVDANESWSVDAYQALVPPLVQLGVTMIEQPFPAGRDEALEALERPIPVCADESCHTRADLPGLRGRYDMVNIKLDKTGGLSEACALMKQARQAGFDIMVGCMLSGSLAIAPARLLAPQADLVDLDGPLLLAEDHACPIAFRGDQIGNPAPGLWGACA